jgi:excisionase family DNA binding protein
MPSTKFPTDELARMPELLKVPEVAAYLRYSLERTYALVRSGDLPSVRVGRAVRVPRDRLLALLNDERPAATPAARSDRPAGGYRAAAE